jgi:hypothetical protein
MLVIFLCSYTEFVSIAEVKTVNAAVDIDAAPSTAGEWILLAARQLLQQGKKLLQKICSSTLLLA